MQARFHRSDRLAQRLGHLLVRAFLDIAEQGAGSPVVRVTIDAKSPVLVGQQVTVRVQVLVPNFFMSGLEFSAINIRGTIVARPGADAEHLSETIRGERYAGIAQSFVVTPQQAGEFTLPPARITFTYAATPGQATDGAVTLPPRSFAVKLPAGGLAPGATPGTPVAKVTVTQSLDRGVDGVKVGDALTRTVSAFAERTPATMIPPPAFDAPAGVRVYRMDPVLSDETKDRVGLIGGHRTDRVTYLFEKPGDYTRPAIEIGWLNPATSMSETARAPAIAVHVAPNSAFVPALAPELPPTSDAPRSRRKHLDGRRWGSFVVGAVGGWLLAGWLLRRYRPRYLAWRQAHRHTREESEPAYFARVARACRANDAPGAYRALGAWTRRADAKSIAAWCADLGDPGSAGRSRRSSSGCSPARPTAPGMAAASRPSSSAHARRGCPVALARAGARPDCRP